MRATGTGIRWAVRLHRWMGLVLAAVLLLSAVSGIAIAWRDHIWRAQHPELNQTVPALGIVELAEAANRLVSRHAPGELRLLSPPRADLSGWHLRFTNGEQALYTADAERLLARWQETTSPFGVLHHVHIDLLAGEAGRWVMGAVGLGAIVLILSGCIGWLRNPRRPTIRQLTPSTLRRGVWMVAHRQWGVIAAAPAILLMLTGMLMSWSWLWRSHLPAPDTFATGTPVASGTLLAAFRRIEQEWPDGTVRLIDVSEMSSNRLTARVRQPEEVHPNGRTSITVSLSGDVIERYDALQAGVTGKVDDLVYPLHSGRVDWPGWHLGVVICGLILTGLSLSGMATWLGTRKRQAPPP
ncbi:MAG: PepSY-associated TM helix domain-containing protein [Pseudomonadales bacterium]